MKLLHTSDWHLGRSLFDRKRHDEHAAFLNWLIDTLESERIDTLLISGDIFDTGIPGTHAQHLYYDFLCRAARTCCRHIIIIAGNHDSPSFLNAPRDLLQHLNIHVFGAVTSSPTDNVLALRSIDGTVELIVCAIPYLRDRDIRQSESGESTQDKERKLVEGISRQFRETIFEAERVRDGLAVKVPIVVMGHLFATGGETIDGDGVRELYVGSLARVGAEIFPSCVDYAALGHLHVPQRIGGSDSRRYSGCPIPMGFNESSHPKSVVIVSFDCSGTIVTLRTIPCFQELVRLRGNLDTILNDIACLKNRSSRAWLEIDYTDSAVQGNLSGCIADAISDSSLEVLRIRNRSVMNLALTPSHDYETLDDLTVNDVFERCLDLRDVPIEQRDGLRATYLEILHALNDPESTPPVGGAAC